MGLLKFVYAMESGNVFKTNVPVTFSYITFNYSVDMTLDKAVCVIDSRSRITISLSCNGASAVMIHPNGKVHQIGTCVEIVAYDGTKRNNFM